MGEAVICNKCKRPIIGMNYAGRCEDCFAEDADRSYVRTPVRRLVQAKNTAIKKRVYKHKSKAE